MRVLILLLVMFTGCNMTDTSANYEVTSIGTYCHRGVLYLKFSTGAVLAVDENGKPLKCK